MMVIMYRTEAQDCKGFSKDFAVNNLFQIQDLRKYI